jgi:hypothetical protein
MSRSRILVASHYNRRRLIGATNSRMDLSNDVRDHAQLACVPITP